MKKMKFWGRTPDDDKLVREVLCKEKTVTCTPKAWWGKDPEEEATEPGDLVAVFDGRGRFRCTVRIVAVREMRMGDVDEHTLRGEYIATKEDFVRLHRECWEEDLAKEGLRCDDDLEMIVEEFVLVNGNNIEVEDHGR